MLDSQKLVGVRIRATRAVAAPMHICINFKKNSVKCLCLDEISNKEINCSGTINHTSTLNNIVCFNAIKWYYKRELVQYN